MQNRPPRTLGPLYARPGFLLWRAHHIAVSIFSDECREFGITAPQHAVLSVVQQVAGTDQAGVSRMAGLDRFTTALVLSNLIKRGLIVREKGSRDRRRYCLQISPLGLELMDRMQSCAAHAQKRLTSAFTVRERRVFFALLKRMVTVLNNDARAPIDEASLPLTRNQLRRVMKVIHPQISSSRRVRQPIAGKQAAVPIRRATAALRYALDADPSSPQ